MLKKIIAIGIAGLLILGVSIMLTNNKVDASPKIEEEVPSIMVSGHSQISVDPDTATINLSVVTENEDSLKAQTDNARIMDSVYESLGKAGITKDSIKTTGYYLNQRKDYNNNGNVSRTYFTVENKIAVTTMKLDKVGELVGIASKAGANRFEGVNFSISNSSQQYNNALKLAVKNAKSKAEALAIASGTSMGKIIKITESSANTNTRYNDTDLNLSMKEAKPSDFIAPISAGELLVEARVIIVYSINQ